MTDIKTQLLAPAGSLQCLYAAVNAGCDAVYVGGQLYGARAYAANFSTEELVEAIDYVHLYDKKLYLTVNTLMKNSEINNLYDYLLPLYRAGLDAVIVQDLGCVSYIHEHFKDLEIHASTQMTVFSKYFAKLLKKYNVTRIVAPRELNCNELHKLHEETQLELEAFIHGALCYSYSGQCLLSSLIGGRSGNRGRCAGPCRKEYLPLIDNIPIGKSKYYMSLSDMCTLPILKDVINSSVYSLKIEGRMKKPEYVAAVVSTYRKYLDKFEAGISISMLEVNKDTDFLGRIYSRGKYNQSYYNIDSAQATTNNSTVITASDSKSIMRNMITYDNPSYNTNDDQALKLVYDKYIAENKAIPINGTFTIDSSLNICFNVSIEYKDTILNYSVNDIAEVPINAPITKEQITKQLLKTKSTCFEFKKLCVDIVDSFIRVSTLNEIRRQALDGLKNEVIKNFKREADEYNNAINNRKSNDMKVQHDSIAINVLVTTHEQLNCLLSADILSNISRLYLSFELEADNSILKKIHSLSKSTLVYYVFPDIFKSNVIAYYESNFEAIDSLEYDGYLVRNLDQLAFLKENSSKAISTDSSIYCFNNFTIKEMYNYNVASTCMPVELNYKELMHIEGYNQELIAYGYTKAMTSSQCVNNSVLKCDCTPKVIQLKDQTNTDFRVRNICKFCYNNVYNSKILSLLNMKDEIILLNRSSACLNAIRLEFVFENATNLKQILNKYVNMFIYNAKDDNIPEYTNGHFKRGVE